MARQIEPQTPPLDPRRALTLDEVLGNEPIRTFLRRAWSQGRLPQALLFSGPPGIGKTTMAWALAREIVAEGEDPATSRRSLKIERGVHPDVIELTGAGSKSSQILVENMRAMDDRTGTAPMESPRKIVLIEPADRMNASSANALLKLLEEPPPHLLLMLVTPEPNRLLPTIRSRCAPLNLEPVPIEMLTAWLCGKEDVDEERARLIASLAEGRPGYARMLAGQGVMEGRERILEGFQLLLGHGFSVIFKVADTLNSLSPNLADTLTTAMTLLRDALVIRMDGEGILHRDLREALTAFANGRSPEGLLEAAERLERAAAEAPYFYSPQARIHFVECVTTDIGRLLRTA